MRVSEKFQLGVTQASLDFVDVDIQGDVPVFVDPKAIRLQQGAWAETCQALIQSFFEELLKAIKSSNKGRIASLVLHLGEPNETHLGMSGGESRGRGLGSGKKSQELVDALADNVAGKAGLLQDLDETSLFVEGVGRDIISDITTNIIRGPLITYTQNVCEFYDIPIYQQHAGHVWDDRTKSWVEIDAKLPRADSDKLLLVPRSIVRIRPLTDKGKYYRGYIRPYFEQIELSSPTSELIRTLKNGTRKVQLTELDKLIDQSKSGIVKHTQRWPGAIDSYRKNATVKSNPPLDHEDFEDDLGAEKVDFRELLDSVKAISPGRPGATSYHRAIAELLKALFDASLGNQVLEAKVHRGRKRLDIQYDNTAGFGFFHWLGRHYKAATVVVECKNYANDLANAELDQISSRFAPTRGQFGLLVCRSFEDKALFLERCRDTAKDERGYIIVLDDGDLELLVDHAEETRGYLPEKRADFPLLRERFQDLIA